MLRRSLAILALVASTVAFAPSVAAGGGCVWESSRPSEAGSSADEVTAHIAGCRYEPTTLYIEPGTTVTWLNKDPVPHSVTGPFLTLGSDRLLNRGDTTTVTFDKEGVFPYYCVLHPGMAASVVVGDPIDGERKDLAAGIGDTGGSAGGTDDGSFPMAAGVAGIALAGLAGAAFMVRTRRRAMPVPDALP